MMKTHHRAIQATFLALMLTCAPGVTAEDQGVPTQAAPGASFVRVVKNTGSYGTGESLLSMTRLPPITWKGQELGAWQQANGPTLLMGPTGSFVALLAGDKPMFTYDPPASYQWPLKAGKTWTSRWTITDHARQRDIPVEVSHVVEAHEDVSLPAGTFKAWRIRTADNQGNEDLRWFSTELGIWVKEKLVRTDRHPSGPGTRETELQSQTIR